MIMTFEDIPEDVITEISYMLGSIEECQSDYLQPILERHGYQGDFLIIEPDEDEDLTLDIYKELFLTGICAPFINTVDNR